MSENPEVDMALSKLTNKDQGDLLDLIGAYALSQEPESLKQSLALDRPLDSKQLRKTAEKFLKKIEPIVKNALCGSDGILSYIEQPTVKDIIAVILPALGFQVGGMVPTAVIAVCIIIFRAGVREYCKTGYATATV